MFLIKAYYLVDQGCENCSFYMRTGVCGYGASCKFHHPPPIFFTVESMDSQNEASEINEGDAGHVVPHFSQSTNSHVRVLKFGSFPSVTSGNLVCPYNQYLSIDFKKKL